MHDSFVQAIRLMIYSTLWKCSEWMELDYFVRFECGPLLKLTYSSYFSKRIRFSIGCQIHWFTIQLDFTSQYFVWFWIIIMSWFQIRKPKCATTKGIFLYFFKSYTLIFLTLNFVEMHKILKNISKIPSSSTTNDSLIQQNTITHLQSRFFFHYSFNVGLQSTEQQNSCMGKPNFLRNKYFVYIFMLIFVELRGISKTLVKFFAKFHKDS